MAKVKLFVAVKDENGNDYFSTDVTVASGIHATAVVRAISDTLDCFCDEDEEEPCVSCGGQGVVVDELFDCAQDPAWKNCDACGGKGVV